MYADDIVVMADKPIVLQGMIDKIAEYCRRWNLITNLDKSKIVVFRKRGGRLSAQEQWKLNNDQIEVVTKYKYLGVWMTPGLSLTEHFKERTKLAKQSLNLSWSNFIANKDVSLSSKIELFNAVTRAIVTYGAQVWGHTKYEEVEKLQRCFFKKVLGLPRVTPNYALTLECQMKPILEFTMRCHMNYIGKVFNCYEDNRLPKILARSVKEKRIYWFEMWQNSPVLTNLEELVADRNLFHTFVNNETHKIVAEDHQEALQRANLTRSHGLYHQLNYEVGRSYVGDNQKISVIR